MNSNNKQDYLGTKFSQHLFPTGQVNEEKNFKEEALGIGEKEEFWNQALKDSEYEGKFSMGKQYS